MGLKEKQLYKMSIIIVLIILVFISILISTGFGAVHISVSDVLKALIKQEDGVNRSIIWNVRFPRTLVAGLTGMCLSLSGAILQGIMRNPLASPSIIGVSSGAGIAGMVIIILFPEYLHLLTPVSFLGAFIATVLIYLLAWENGIKPTRMILSGIAVSSFLNAGINSLMSFFPDRVHGAVDFMVGGLGAKTWKHLHMMWPYAIFGFVICILLSGRLNVLMLGDEVATSLGLNVERTRIIFILISSLLAANAVSIVGLLGFVGLIVPHIIRLLIGSDFKYLIPASALGGAVLLILCDTVARLVIQPAELPVGIMMSMLGAPFFLYLLRGGMRINAKA